MSKLYVHDVQITKEAPNYQREYQATSKLQVKENNMNIFNEELEQFCRLYNLPIQHLGKILKDPKVIPMIRGKAFEFSVCDRLEGILNSQIWKVDKPFLNPQLGSHDEDVVIKHLITERKFTVECKLTAKGEFRYDDNDKTYIVKVKCMRSRTLGNTQVQRLAPMLGVSPESLAVHNDQYRPQDFNFVITSLANAFYETDENGIFVWQPSEMGRLFLAQKYGNHLSDEEYQDRAFADMYVACSSDIAISSQNDIHCTRRRCSMPKNCGFIPNYPQIIFDSAMNVVNGNWFPINQIETLLG